MDYRDELESFLKKYQYQEMKIGSAVIRYVTAGDEGRPCVVFLNGGMNCSEMWFKYVEKMSASYRTVIFDYPIELKTCEETADAVSLFLKKLNINKAFFAGASFGGLMAQIFAKKYPETVSGLGLFSTARLDERTIRNSKKKFLILPLFIWYMKHCNYDKLKIKSADQSLKRYAVNETPQDKQYLRQMFECMFKDYTREKDIHITSLMSGLDLTPCERKDFSAFDDRVLLIFPEKDFFSADEQASLKHLFPKARVEYIKNGHFGTVLECDKYIRLMQEIIDMNE
ncbi:MAG: alpha/beta hydrolase [Oscillospiraceae bacterium]|nr:alpha/beta hydrolase [Oscillospiraceae bacterium]